jgi:hypothetical protein
MNGFNNLSKIKKWFLCFNFTVLLYFSIYIFFQNYNNNLLKLLTRLNYKWIINTNSILQHSGYMVLKSNKKLSLEAFIFNTSVLNGNLSFILWNSIKNFYYRVDVIQKININSPLIKVFCDFDEIVYTDNYTSFYGTIVLKNKNIKNSVISFQKLTILDSRKEKEKVLAIVFILDGDLIL